MAYQPGSGRLQQRRSVMIAPSRQEESFDSHDGEVPLLRSNTHLPNGEATKSSYRRSGEVPLLGQKVTIDDENATIIFIFPRNTDWKGTVNPDEIVQEPEVKFRKIFVRPHNHSTEKVVWPYEPGQSVSMARYQEVVRNSFLQVLQQSGMRAERMDSVDGDEVFLKVSLNRDGTTIRKLAEQMSYRLPFTRESYKMAEAWGVHPAGRPMVHEGSDLMVPAHHEFAPHLEERLGSFRTIDEIRIIERRLDDWVSILEMEHQGITSRHFAAANYGEMMKLHDDWADWWLIFSIPDHEQDERIRNYFGEEIAFFFLWFAFYTRKLGILACFGMACWLRFLPLWDLDDDTMSYIQMGFGFVMNIWATSFNELFKGTAARAQQRWGMKDWDMESVQLPSYDQTLEGTRKLQFFKIMSKTCTALYTFVFLSSICAIEGYMIFQKRAGNDVVNALMPYLLSFVVKGGSFMWAKVAPILVRWENHRTQARWNNALAWNLANVKLLAAVWPFILIAFVQDDTGKICGDRLDIAAHHVYRDVGWPIGVTVSVPPGNVSLQIPLAELQFLDGFWEVEHETKDSCIKGCFPVQCNDGTAKTCVTSCMRDLKDSLGTLYGLHMVSTVLFLLIPVVLTKMRVMREINEAKGVKLKDAAQDIVGGRLPGQDLQDYSFLQFQAKCHAEAPYEYASFGGSYVEDFLELAIGFMLLTCFGLSVPRMAFVGFLCHVAEYRILAYRMTCVTCRPFPRGAEGIGIWQEIFEKISGAAVVINVAMITINMAPVKGWRSANRLLFFIVVEKALHLLRSVVSFQIPAKPDDVILAEDFNVNFKRRAERQGLNRVHHVSKEDEMFDRSQLDIGLHPPDRPYPPRSATSSDSEE